jgi:hypothetical protein
MLFNIDAKAQKAANVIINPKAIKNTHKTQLKIFSMSLSLILKFL